MSKLNRGFNQTALNGSIGAVTYVTRKGITVAKQKVPAKISYRKTLKNMPQKMKWVNLLRMWQALNVVGWRPSFTNKTGLQTDFNLFTKANIGFATLYLPKPYADAGAGVVVPVQITQGSLPQVGGQLDDQNKFVSNLNLGGLTIGASTTVAALSTAIIEHNDGWRDHDQLTIVILNQTVGDSDNVPRIKSDIYQLYLNSTDETTIIGDLFDANILGTSEGKLALGAPLTAGGAAMVHSTETADGYDVSSETLVVNNPMSIQFEGNTALMTAIDSYGGLSRSQFLIPEPSDNSPQGV